MISIPVALQVPLISVMLGIMLCLIFETVGVPEGFRRHGNKNYLSLIAAITVCVVLIQIVRLPPSSATQEQGGLIFDHFSRSAIIALSILVLTILWIIVERLKPTNADRGEVYALLLFSYFTCILICSAHDLMLTSTVILAWPFTQIGILAIRQRRNASPEVALKLVIFAAFILVLLAAVFIFSSMDTSSQLTETRVAATTVIFSLSLLLMGNFPLHSVHVDMLDGSPSYSAAFVCGASLITCSVILFRFVDRFSFPPEYTQKCAWLFMVFAGLSLCLSPILALDQTRLNRLLAYLLSSQSGLVLLSLVPGLYKIALPSHFPVLLFTHFSLCAAGTYAGLNYWKNAKRSFKTWEDFAGAGREHPIAAGAFFVVLASVAGLPFTSGFVLRSLLIELAPSQFRLPFALILLSSVVLSAVPIFRLCAFFFGKATRHEIRKHHQSRQTVLLIFCATSLFLTALIPKSTLLYIFGQ